MPPVPGPPEIARQMLTTVAHSGGSLNFSDIKARLWHVFLPQLSAPYTETSATRLLDDLFKDALALLMRNRWVNAAGETLLLTEQGWQHAGAQMRERQPAPGGAGSDVEVTTLDLSHAEQVIEYRFHNGVVVRGYLIDDLNRFHGKPLTMSAADLLDALYRAEIDGNPANTGFYSAIRQFGSTWHPPYLLVSKCHIRVPTMESAPHPAVSRQRHGGRPGRRVGMTWERLLCELIAADGGHADWPTIAAAAEQRPETEDEPVWREELRQALRNHAAPRGREYFAVTDLGGRVVYALTEKGQKLASRRTEDERAPTLSKLVARAVDPNGAVRLTDMERYVLLFLATRLGKTAEAQAIYQRLPEGFPDDDSYAMIPMWIEQSMAL